MRRTTIGSAAVTNSGTDVVHTSGGLPGPPAGSRRVLLLPGVLLLACCHCLSAQSMALQPAGMPLGALPDAPSPQVQEAQSVTLRNTPRHILGDQETIWTSSARIRTHDLVWLMPLAAAEGVALATDRHTMQSVVSHDAGFNQANVNASNIVIGGYIALPVALYGYGHLEQDEHAREAGILGGEALLDGVVVEQGIKLIFWRERPALDDVRGRFFQGNAGIDSSFPSSHSVLAWSEAAALAGEYSSFWDQVGLYSVATGICVTRVLGQQHFPGDVLAGSAVGWLLGHYIFRARHHRHGADAAH